MEAVIVVMEMDFLTIERPASAVTELTVPVRVLTPGTAAAAAIASVGRVSTWLATPSTGATTAAISMGAASTWEPRLKEPAAMVKNFMLMVES